MVGLGRVELPTSSLGNCCSIHLSYSPDALDYYVFTTIELPGPQDKNAKAFQTIESQREIKLTP
jgi:hypothetical protein